jgi:hypothetical protein
MRATVQGYVRSFGIYQVCPKKGTSQKAVWPVTLKSIAKEAESWSTVNVDMIRPSTVYKKRNHKLVVSIIDPATAWLEIATSCCMEK